MDWFLYDRGLRHESVNLHCSSHATYLKTMFTTFAQDKGLPPNFGSNIKRI